MVNQVKTAAVIGAGIMGQGIAQVFAIAGFRTLLYDLRANQIAQAMVDIRNTLEASLKKGKLTSEQRILAEQNILPCKELSQVTGDLIIEAVVEKLEVKQALFRELEKWNSPSAIFATNTSALSITGIASVLTKPDRFLGLHFFNPAHQMKLVEVIAAQATTPDLVSEIEELLKSVGKTPVRVKDSPGFIVNRVARHYYLESLQVLQDNVADVEGIDKLLKSAGFKMGPFELIDLIGVDTNFSVTESLYKAFYPDPKFKPSKLQEQKIKDGHLGRKTGKGFYDYTKN